MVKKIERIEKIVPVAKVTVTNNPFVCALSDLNQYSEKEFECTFLVDLDVHKSEIRKRLRSQMERARWGFKQEWEFVERRKVPVNLRQEAGLIDEGVVKVVMYAEFKEKVGDSRRETQEEVPKLTTQVNEQ